MFFELLKYKLINICKTIKPTRASKKTSGYVFFVFVFNDLTAF